MNGDDADREVLAFGFWLLAFGFWLLAFSIGSLVVRGEDLEPKSQLPRAKSQNRAITTQADGNESKYIPNNLGLIQAKEGAKMRRLFTTWAVALVCIAMQGIGKAQSLPSGSYQQSCKNVDVRDGVLTANCQDTEGKWEATQLRDFQSCGGDIINDNGALLRAERGAARVVVSPPVYEASPQRFLHADMPGHPRER